MKFLAVLFVLFVTTALFSVIVWDTYENYEFYHPQTTQGYNQ